jgi:ribosomal protein S18 acetylase RimI-like enzyme
MQADDGIRVEKVEKLEPQLIAGIQKLFPQLTQYSPIPEEIDLAKIVASDSTSLWVAKNKTGSILGMLNLAIYRTTTGIHAWIEDVVVDQNARRQGIAAQLTHEAVEYAKDKGAKAVSLTSRPAREAANLLYIKLGFEKVETNLYRMRLD